MAFNFAPAMDFVKMLRDKVPIKATTYTKPTKVVEPPKLKRQNAIKLLKPDLVLPRNKDESPVATKKTESMVLRPEKKQTEPKKQIVGASRRKMTKPVKKLVEPKKKLILPTLPKKKLKDVVCKNDTQNLMKVDHCIFIVNL